MLHARVASPEEGAIAAKLTASPETVSNRIHLVEQTTRKATTPSRAGNRSDGKSPGSPAGSNQMDHDLVVGHRLALGRRFPGGDTGSRR